MRYRILCMPILYFSSPVLRTLKRLFGLPRWTLGGSLGVPKVAQGSQMGPEWFPNGCKNVSQKVSRPQNAHSISKPYHLLRFSRNIDLARELRNMFLPCQFPLWLLCPLFGHQGDLQKPLGQHLQAIVAPSPVVVQGLSPKRTPKIIQNHFSRMGAPHALPHACMPQGFPMAPQRLKQY